jgi:hypothetical protein
MEATPAECQVNELAHGLQYANRVVAVAHGLFNFGRPAGIPASNRWYRTRTQTFAGSQ